MTGMSGGPGMPVSPPGVSNAQLQIPPPTPSNQTHDGHAANGGHAAGVNSVSNTGIARASGNEGQAMNNDGNEEEEENGLTDDAE